MSDEKTGDALPGANVLVQGLEIGAATNVDGEFTITGVAVGQRSVIARFIGYKSNIQVVNVVAGEVTELNFNLKETVLTLDEVVVTGAGVATEKRKLGNTVVSLNTKDIEDAPVTNFSDMIAAREAGVEVKPQGGLVGMGAEIRIRGSSSLAMSNEPVVYLDGVRVNNGAGCGPRGAGGRSGRWWLPRTRMGLCRRKSGEREPTQYRHHRGRHDGARHSPGVCPGRLPGGVDRQQRAGPGKRNRAHPGEPRDLS